jgi:hypothetical protein
MSLPALLQLDRPERIPLDRTATLRDVSQKPLDVTVHNISSTGCLVSTETELPDNMLVTIGIAGLGTRPARIARQETSLYGLAFLKPASESELSAAHHAETLVDGGFTAPLPATEPAPVEDDRLSPRARFLFLVGSSVLLWSGLGVGITALLR